MKRIFRLGVTYALAFTLGFYIAARPSEGKQYGFSCIEELHSRRIKHDIDGWINEIKQYRKEAKNV